MPTPPNALQVLRTDHVSVRNLLEQLYDTTTRAVKRRRTLLEDLGTELRIHARIEEEIFYPALRDAARKEQQRFMVQALERLHVIERTALPELEHTEVVDTAFSGRTKTLKEMVEHHVEEEEGGMFALARQLLDEDRLAQLGSRLLERKEALLQEAG